MNYPYKNKIDPNLLADCENCFGLCCVALHFSASDGFPDDKVSGRTCQNLEPDFRCRIHKNLTEKGLKGCISYDCFGAGQKVSKVTYQGKDWRHFPASAEQMFQSFLIMWQLHELLWYLYESLTLEPARSLEKSLSSMLAETKKLTHLSPESLLKMDRQAYREKVNVLLLKVSELVRADSRHGQKNKAIDQKHFGRGADLIGADLRKLDLRGANLRGAYLIAADAREADLTGADLIGADLRDTDLRGADLSKSIFLTQGQINSAKGDPTTKIPPLLTCPIHWLSEI